MAISIQKGFWRDEYIGATRQKLEDIFYNNPEAFSSEKQCILEYWAVYEHLPEVLEDKWPPFKAWFMKAVSPETVTRARRSLREDGTIQLRNREEGYECKQ